MSGIRIVAVSGSVRSASSNTVLLRAAAVLAPPGVEVVLYDGLGTLFPVPTSGRRLDAAGAAADPEIAGVLRAALAALVEEARA